MIISSFGSFFGPSQPVIARRVIQENKSLLENPHLAAKVSKANNGRNGVFASAPLGSKPQANDHPSEITSQLKPKAKIQMIRNMRDYSFLLSDDVELPAPTKNLSPSASILKSEAQLARTIPGNTGRKVLNSREGRTLVPTVSQKQAKLGSKESSFARKPNSTSVDFQKQLGGNNGIRPDRPSGQNDMPSKNPMATREEVSSVTVAESPMPGVRKPLPSKFPSFDSKQPLEQKKDCKSSNGKMMTKQPVSLSKPQIKQRPAKFSDRATLQEDRQKKRPVRRYSDDEGDAINEIRKLLRYDPRKYRDDDDDCDNMEATFDEIQKEEKDSLDEALREDAEQWHLQQEEEKRAQMRRAAKKRKLS